ncbi:hypothetical protein OIU78_006563 [Salix suchowensis]|nr:hypothetical protein OIU78_006563 [Salix suchowensis]
MAALDKMFVSLRVIKTTDDRPNGGNWCVDGLNHHGAALVGPQYACVVARNVVWYRECPMSVGPSMCSPWFVIVYGQCGWRRRWWRQLSGAVALQASLTFWILFR